MSLFLVVVLSAFNVVSMVGERFHYLEHPRLIKFYIGDYEGRCTSYAIAPNLLLTVKHCFRGGVDGEIRVANTQRVAFLKDDEGKLNLSFPFMPGDVFEVVHVHGLEEEGSKALVVVELKEDIKIAKSFQPISSEQAIATWNITAQGLKLFYLNESRLNELNYFEGKEHIDLSVLSDEDFFVGDEFVGEGAFALGYGDDSRVFGYSANRASKVSLAPLDFNAGFFSVHNFPQNKVCDGDSGGPGMVVLNGAVKVFGALEESYYPVSLKEDFRATGRSDWGRFNCEKNSTVNKSRFLMVKDYPWIFNLLEKERARRRLAPSN